MADNFGLKIGVEGEKEFKQALSDINRQFKVLGSEMNLVTSQFDKQDKSMEALAARNGVLSKEIEAQKGKIDTLKAALDNAASSFGETDKRTLAWQTQLNNAQAELNKMERELSENNRALDEAAKGFEDAEKQADEFGDEVEKSAKEADSAGGKFEKLGSIVKGVGAAMATAFAAVGAATVAAAKALTDMTVGAAAYADEILTASTVTGMSTESLQAYKYAAELVDVPLETLTKSMAKNVKSMSTAQSGTGAMAEAYAKLGVAVTDSSGQLRDSETVYWEAIDALGGVTNETERDAIAMQIFGKSAQELNPLIAQGSAGIAALTEEAKRMGAVMSDEQLADLGAFDDSIQRLKAGSAAAKNALGLVLLPQLQALATDGVSLLGDFTKGMLDAGGDWSRISEVIGNAVGGIADLLLSNLPKIVEVGTNIVLSLVQAVSENTPALVDAAGLMLSTLIDGFIKALPKITEGAVKLVATLVKGISENLPKLVEAAIQMIATLAQGVAEALPELIPAVVEAVATIVQTLADNLPLLLEAGLQLLMGLVQGILDAIPQLIEALPAIITAIVEFIVGAIPQIIEAGIQLLTSLVEALPDIITAIVEAIPQIIDGIVAALMESIPLIVQAGIDLLVALIQALPDIIVTIVEALPQLITGIVEGLLGNIDKIIMAGVQLFVSLIENLPTIIVEIVKAVPQIIAGIVEAFGNLLYKIVEVGASLVKGLWEGIQSMISWLWNKVSGWVSGLVNDIKGALGIHSPSTVFAGIGENMGLGLGRGFVEAIHGVERDMQRAIPTDFDVDASVGGAFAGVGSAAGPAHAFNVTIPLTLDGATLGRILAEIQWTQQAVYVRNLGTV